MKRVSLLVVALLALASAQPRPAYNGDYWTRNENPWYDWIVVSKELAGRLHPNWPADWMESGAEVRWNCWAWPVVAQFPKGILLKAAPDVAGQIIIKDENNDSWLRVFLDEEAGTVCFVRCNRKFLKPYAAPPSATPSPQE
jgi:hypothetical protein